MNRQEFQQRLNTLLAQEGKNPLSWWYLSYAGETEFLGGLIIQAHGPTEATYLSRHRGISPGGEVLILQVPDDQLPPDEYRNRLLTRQELNTFWEEDTEEQTCPATGTMGIHSEEYHDDSRCIFCGAKQKKKTEENDG